ncbi:MAG: hypothetical protein JXA91_04255 [Candidatus Thermoplasmatota archaeon]|nr:hypothetical protein [Candidatus Thermoplasmatota archaeon]
MLLVVTGFAIFLRSIPSWSYAAWGCDFGIYYGLTNSFVQSGELFSSYFGWGGSYQYFPVLYAITGIVHWATGIEVITLMPKLAPIFGGLSVLIFYFIVKELIGEEKIALLSSLVLAVLPFHAYQTSHASPLTMGHFFMMMSMYLFIKYRQDHRYVVPLFISTILLIMSHHFSTYFFLISLVSIVFFENLSRSKWTASLKIDIMYILLASVLIFSYWVFVATPVYESFMNNRITIGSIPIPSMMIIFAFYLVFLLSIISIILKRKLNIFIERKQLTFRKNIIRFVFTITLCFIGMGIFTFIKMPWTNIQFTPLTIIFSIPLVAIFGFAVVGFSRMKFIKNGYFIRGWLISILLSFLYGIINSNWAFYPHRHLEYMMIPLSVMSIYGIRDIFLRVSNDSITETVKKFPQMEKVVTSQSSHVRLMKKRQVLYLFVVVIIVTTNAVSIYPSHVALNASYEAITNENLAAVEWMKENLDTNNSIVASDHRLARIAEAVGFNTTLDNATKLWDSINLTDYLDELMGIEKQYESKITHIIIDYIMKERVVHVGFADIAYMTNESYYKFTVEPFELLYRNASIDPETMQYIHWTEVYAVNWSYIDKYELGNLQAVEQS